MLPLLKSYLAPKRTLWKLNNFTPSHFAENLNILYLTQTFHDSWSTLMREICLKFSVIFDFKTEQKTEDIKWELKVLLQNLHQEKMSRIWLELMHWMKLALGLYKFLVLSHFRNWVWHPWLSCLYSFHPHRKYFCLMSRTSSRCGTAPVEGRAELIQPVGVSGVAQFGQRIHTFHNHLQHVTDFPQHPARLLATKH